MLSSHSHADRWGRVLITGAAGFLGQSLSRTLIAAMRSASGLMTRPTQIPLRLNAAQASGPGGLNQHEMSVRPAELLLTDAAPRPSWCPDDDPRIRWVCADLSEPGVAPTLVDERLTGVFHLAGVVSGAAEADFDRGLRVNLDATRALAMACARTQAWQSADRAPAAGSAPIAARAVIRFVHASSIAVYGVPLPEHIDDTTQPWPTLSYGAQKLASELLLADMSRRGMIDSLSLRLSGVVVRPTLPNGALSAFNSDLIRETLAGRRITSPVSAAATLWLQSIDITVHNLIHAMSLSGAAPDGQRSVLLPAVAASVQEIVVAVSAQIGRDAADLVDYQPNPAIEPMFGRWPRSRANARALCMGFRADDSLSTLIAAAAGRRDTAAP